MFARLKRRIAPSARAAPAVGAGSTNGEGADAAHADNGLAAASAGSQEGDLESLPFEFEDASYPWLYHEQQVGALCAVHSLNNLFQGPYFDENSFRLVSSELDQAERALTEGLGVDEGNARTDGYFNVQVMQVLLERTGFSMRPFRSSWPAPDGADPADETAFILNRREHWFSVLKVRGQWFDLNSKLRKPRLYQVPELRAQLSGFLAEGWMVFVVRGDFAGIWGEPPVCPALSFQKQVGCLRSCRRSIAAFIAAFIYDWFDPTRFEPSLIVPSSSEQPGARCRCCRRRSRQPRPPSGAAPSAPAARGWVAGSSRPPVPEPRPPPQAPPPQEPPQLKNSYMEPDVLDRHFRVDDGFDGPCLPTCPSHHFLEPLGRTRDNGWTCDGTSFKGGCRHGINKPGRSAGQNRFRCSRCNYDLCEWCYQSFHDPNVPPDLAKPRLPSRLVLVTFVESFVAVILWVLSVALDNVHDTLSSGAGLDYLIEPVGTTTTFRLHRDCLDLRREVWRWLSYRYTHLGLGHCLIASALVLLFGVPLEGFHGCVRMFLFINVGTISGAAFHGIFDVHTELMGLASVYYTFFGLHLADLLLNWHVGRYRLASLLLIWLAVALDLGWLFGRAQLTLPAVDASAAERVGGIIAGVLLGLACGNSLLGKRWRWAIRIVAALLLAGIILFAATWVAVEWPPRGPWENDAAAWCWSRRVNEETMQRAMHANADFGAFPVVTVRGQNCARCAEQACIDHWNGLSSDPLAPCDGAA